MARQRDGAPQPVRGVELRITSVDRDWEEMVYRWATEPRLFREYERWRRPWWARAVAWGIAGWLVVKR